MPNSLLTVSLYACLPVAATAVGATFAAVRPPGPRLRSAIQHFAAGVVFSVVAVELLPDVTRVHDPFEIGWTFAAGVALMLGLRWVTERRAATAGATAAGATAVSTAGESAPPGAPGEALAGASPGQLVAVGIDILIDGLLVGIAFAAGAKEGILLTVALSLELLSLGLAVASTLGPGPRWRTVLIPTALSLLLVVGAVAGETVLRGASEHTLAGVLSFGAAALLYLVTEELLVEAHEAGETTGGTAMFFAGFLLFLLLGMAE